MASSRRAVAPLRTSSERASTSSIRCWYCGTRAPRNVAGLARSASAPGVIRVIPLIEKLDGFLALARQQYFSLLLRAAQGGLALARECDAAFECLQCILERHVALLEPGHECFEFAQGLLEV